jgi:hypothetical protein
MMKMMKRLGMVPRQIFSPRRRREGAYLSDQLADAFSASMKCQRILEKLTKSPLDCLEQSLFHKCAGRLKKRVSMVIFKTMD